MLGSIVLLIIETIVGLFTLVLLARFLMQWLRISFRSTLGHFVMVATDWLVKPLRRAIPGLFGLDMATLLPAWLLQTGFAGLELALRGVPIGGEPALTVLGLLGMGMVGLMRITVYVVLVVVLISAVMTWVNPHAPAAAVFHELSAPFLRPFRRLVPTIANVDLSPLVLLLVLQIVLIVLASVHAAFVPMVVG